MIKSSIKSGKESMKAPARGYTPGI